MSEELNQELDKWRPHADFAVSLGFREYCLQLDHWLCGECGAIIGEVENCQKHHEWHRNLESLRSTPPGTSDMVPLAKNSAASFEILNLSCRARNGLYRFAEDVGLFCWDVERGVYIRHFGLTVADIAALDPSMLRRVRNIGNVTIWEINAALNEYGLSLRPDKQGILPNVQIRSEK